MPIRGYTVRKRLRPDDSIELASAREDFELTGEHHATADVIAQNPNITLYGFDDKEKVAVFVETPAGVDLLASPFFYQAQRKHAQQVYLVDREVLLQMGSDISLPTDKLFLIYSVGRCGSTWLYNMLSELSETSAVSEPDVYTALVWSDLAAPDKVEIIRAATKLLWSRYGADKDRLVIKFRGAVCLLWEEMDAALNQPPSMFMYRNAVDVAQSADRVEGSVHGRTQWLLQWPIVRRIARVGLRQGVDPKLFRRFTSLLSGTTAETVVLSCGWSGWSILDWLRLVECYLAARARSGDAVVALRYEDLRDAPEKTLTSLFLAFGLPAAEAANCCRNASTDSQEGTRLARKKPTFPFDKRTVEAIREVFRHHTKFEDPGVILPGTVRPGALSTG